MRTSAETVITRPPATHAAPKPPFMGKEGLRYLMRSSSLAGTHSVLGTSRMRTPVPVEWMWVFLVAFCSVNGCKAGIRDKKRYV